MEAVEGEIWCDVHGCVHDAVTNPYNGAWHHKDEDGKPVWLIYVDLDKDGNVVENPGSYGSPEVVESNAIRPAPPDCLPTEWRKLWAGARVETA